MESCDLTESDVMRPPRHASVPASKEGGISTMLLATEYFSCVSSSVHTHSVLFLCVRRQSIHIQYSSCVYVVSPYTFSTLLVCTSSVHTHSVLFLRIVIRPHTFHTLLVYVVSPHAFHTRLVYRHQLIHV